VIGHAPRGDLNEPAARIVGQTAGRPLRGGSQQGFLNGVF
jgi:hypothetical protein